MGNFLDETPGSEGSPVCVNHQNCGGRKPLRNPPDGKLSGYASSWCDNCNSGLTLPEKFYLIGFIDPWPINNFSSEQYCRDAYDLGCADRIGEYDE